MKKYIDLDDVRKDPVKQKENQIIELGQHICDVFPKSVLLERGTILAIDFKEMATALYNADYRKQREGKWVSEIVKKCDWKWRKQNYYQPNSCSLCHEAVLTRTPYCPNCGAKMEVHHV